MEEQQLQLCTYACIPLEFHSVFPVLGWRQTTWWSEARGHM